MGRRAALAGQSRLLFFFFKPVLFHKNPLPGEGIFFREIDQGGICGGGWRKNLGLFGQQAQGVHAKPSKVRHILLPTSGIRGHHIIGQIGFFRIRRVEPGKEVNEIFQQLAARLSHERQNGIRRMFRGDFQLARNMVFKKLLQIPRPGFFIL